MSTDPRDAIPLEERRRYLEAALAFRDVCREVIANIMSSGFEVDTKSDRSLVTTADLEAERAFRMQVQARFPAAGLLGEEFGATGPESGLRWVIDPVDGTAEFAHGLPLWGTIIGLWLDDDPLVGVIDHPGLATSAHAAYGLGAWRDGQALRLEDMDPGTPDAACRLGLPSRAAFVKFADEGGIFEALTRALPNTRTFHTCYAHTLAASGGLDAAMEWNVPLWDVGATRILLEEAGGAYRVLRTRHQPGVGPVSSAVFGRPGMVARVVDALAPLLPSA